MELSFAPMYTRSVNVAARSVDATLSSETIDSYGEVIEQGSWRLERFRRNPVLLYMHNPREVIGYADELKVTGDQLHGRLVFASTPRAAEVFTLFKDQAMRAFSVGFRVGRVESVTTAGRKVDRLCDCELFEVSAVSIPANPDAVVRHKSLGLVTADYELRSHDPGAVVMKEVWRRGKLTQEEREKESAARHRAGIEARLPQGDPSADLVSLINARVWP